MFDGNIEPGGDNLKPNNGGTGGQLNPTEDDEDSDDGEPSGNASASLF